MRAYKEVGKDFYFFVQPTLGYTFSESKTTQSSVSNYSKLASLGLSVAPGLSYNVFKNFYMDVSLPNVAALYYSNTKSGAFENRNFNFATSLNSQALQNLNLGFSLVL